MRGWLVFSFIVIGASLVLIGCGSGDDAPSGADSMSSVAGGAIKNDPGKPKGSPPGKKGGDIMSQDTSTPP